MTESKIAWTATEIEVETLACVFTDARWLRESLIHTMINGNSSAAYYYVRVLCRAVRHISLFSNLHYVFDYKEQK